MRKFTKTIALFIALALVLPAGAYPVAAAGAAVSATSFLNKKAGDKVGDYTIREVTDLKVFDAKVYVLEHDRTGAKVEFIHNDDPDKYFALEFVTPVNDDRGTPHVFEHSATNGSEKYPSRSLSMALYAQAYITFANALTQDKNTLYPIASLSEKELLKLADFYTDSCFNPMILKDEDIFRSEAWRYSLTSPEDPITINGTIYSEMSGYGSAELMSVRKALGLLYPGCSASYESGGVPSEILKLTYEDVIAYHEKYYHPSNCIVYLYGDIDNADDFLTLLDGYFDEYDRKTISTSTGSGAPSAGFYIEKKYDYPESAGTDVNNKTEMTYAVDLGNPSDEELIRLYDFAASCNPESSTFQLRLKSLYPLSTFDVNVQVDDKGCVMYVGAHGMNESDAKVFKESVQKIFADMATNGLGPDEIANFKKTRETDAALTREFQNSQTTLLLNMANTYTAGRGELFYIGLRDSRLDMENFDNDLVKNIAKTYLASPKRSAMTIVVPRPGLAEEESKKLADKLAAKKASMSSAEINKLIEDTKRITQKASDDPSEYLKELSVVGVKDLPDLTPKFKVSDETDRAGTRRIGVTTSKDGIAFTQLCLDATGLPQEMLYYLALYVDLVNGHFIPAGIIPRDDVAKLVDELTLRGQDISLTVTSYGNDYKPYVRVSFMSGPDTTADAFGLTFQRLFNSDFSDASELAEGISAIKNTVRTNMENSPERFASLIAYGNDSEGSAYYENTHYMEYYDFLTDLEKKVKEDAAKISANLTGIERFMNNSCGAVLAYAASEKDRGTYLRYADEFMNNLDNAKHTKVSYRFKKYAYPLAIVTGGQTANNMIATGDVTKFGIDSDDASNPLAYNLVNEEYLMPAVRNNYGAYGSAYSDNFPAACFFTYSDPNAKESLEVLSSISDSWQQCRQSLTAEQLEGYILTMHSDTSNSDGEINDATYILNCVMTGDGADYVAKSANRLKRTTLKDLEKYDGFFDKLGAQGKLVTAGSAEIINRNRDIYTMILDPFSNK